jgi:hypothetical protein
MLPKFKKYGKSPQYNKSKFLPNIDKKSDIEEAGEGFDGFLKNLKDIRKPSNRRKMAKKIIKSMFFK